MSNRRCVFCEGRPLTREHVLPRWLAGAVPWPEPLTLNRLANDVVLSQWDAPPATFTAKIVCATCNSGWMENLESTARPLLTPLLKGEACQLDTEAQRCIAQWALKTALMLDYTYSERYVPQEDYHTLFRLRHTGQPPAPYQVNIASYGGTGFWASYFRCPGQWTMTMIAGGRQRTLKAYTLQFTIGHLLCQVIGHEQRDVTIEVLPGPTAAAFVVPIWPVQAPIVAWPPPTILQDADIQPLSRFMENSRFVAGTPGV